MGALGIAICVANVIEDFILVLKTGKIVQAVVGSGIVIACTFVAIFEGRGMFIGSLIGTFIKNMIF